MYNLLNIISSSESFLCTSLTNRNLVFTCVPQIPYSVMLYFVMKMFGY